MEDSTTSEEDLEALIEGLDYIPGHFHLGLHLNGEARGPVELRRRDTHLRQESLRAQLEAETGWLQYAVRNLLGLLDFHLDQLAEAEEAFCGVCREEPTNLNAWANLGYVNDRLGREAEAGECVEKVSALMGLGDGDDDQDGPRLRAARCLAEQAYAHPWDVELEDEDVFRERLKDTVIYFGLFMPLFGEDSEELWTGSEAEKTWGEDRENDSRLDLNLCPRGQ